MEKALLENRYLSTFIIQYTWKRENSKNEVYAYESE